MRLLALALAGIAAAASAQEPAPSEPTVVTSAAPERVALTIYRAPNRQPGDPINLERSWQQGYALVTETRIVHLPAGPATLRFEGVAGNIFAETAIVTGLPPGVAERNLDADLLSPRTLYDRALGRRVIVRRTDPATGRMREEQATIRSGPAGAALLQFAGGVEALRCSGLPETLVYPGLPPGLVARPTLSVRTVAPQATIATITLSYLAGGFDWQADYVLTMRPDAEGQGRADLFAWVTLASEDVTPFADAATSVIAGKPRRTGRTAPVLGRERGGLRLRCWPTDIRYGRSVVTFAAAPPPPPPPPPPAAPAMDIMVTGAKRVAVQEDLGDLKLYRLPDRTTVAPRSQKQVAMLVRDGIALDTVYVGAVYGAQAEPPRLTLRTRNSIARGLGVPLPAGGVAVFEGGGARRLLLGEGRLDDRAVGEDVEIALTASPAVTAKVEPLAVAKGGRRYRLTLTNPLPRAIAYEARIMLASDDRIESAARLGRRGEARTWSVTIAANARATLDYRVR